MSLSDKEREEVEKTIMLYIKEHFNQNIHIFLRKGDKERLVENPNKLGIIPYIIEIETVDKVIQTEMFYAVKDMFTEQLYKNTVEYSPVEKYSYVEIDMENYNLFLPIIKDKLN